jgi:hypothetical protein
MTTTQYRIDLRDFINDLPKIAEQLCIQQAQSGLTIVKDRSTRNGIFVDSLDGDYAEYSTNQISTKKFKGKERNSKGVQFIKSNPRGTWHDFRKAQGLQSEKVNLSYTSRMWSSMGIVRTVKFVGGVMTVIGVADSNVDLYLPSLVKRYGNFINPTEDEKIELQKDTTIELLTILKDRL